MEYAAGARLGRSNGHDLRLLLPGLAYWSGLEPMICVVQL
jgi:hypothetical protein